MNLNSSLFPGGVREWMKEPRLGQGWLSWCQWCGAGAGGKAPGQNVTCCKTCLQTCPEKHMWKKCSHCLLLSHASQPPVFAASGPAQFALFKCFLLPLKKAHFKKTNKHFYSFLPLVSFSFALVEHALAQSTFFLGRNQLCSMLTSGHTHEIEDNNLLW